MTHPHDFSLLNDLLDGRMGWSAAEELRRRLAEEPELGSAYDELVRLRAGLQALPRRAPPADFLEGVRARAGLPPRVAAVAASPALPAGGGGAGHAGSGAPGHVIPLRRRFLPLAAAAGLLMGLGGFALWRLRDRSDASPSTQSAAKRDLEGASRAAETKDAHEKLPMATPGAPAPTAPSREQATGAATPHFGAPGGAVAPGLRSPSDELMAPPAAGGPEVRKDAEPGLGALPGSGPAAPDAAPTASTAPGAMPPAPGAPRGGAPSPAEGARGRGSRREPATDDGTPAGGGGAGTGDAAATGSRAPGAKTTGAAADLAWARADADDVVVLRATGYDAARADVTLLLAAVRGGAPVEGRLKDATHLPGARRDPAPGHSRMRSGPTWSDRPRRSPKRPASRRRPTSPPTLPAMPSESSRPHGRVDAGHVRRRDDGSGVGAVLDGAPRGRLGEEVGGGDARSVGEHAPCEGLAPGTAGKRAPAGPGRASPPHPPRAPPLPRADRTPAPRRRDHAREARGSCGRRRPCADGGGRPRRREGQGAAARADRQGRRAARAPAGCRRFPTTRTHRGAAALTIAHRGSRSS